MIESDLSTATANTAAGFRTIEPQRAEIPSAVSALQESTGALGAAIAELESRLADVLGENVPTDSEESRVRLPYTAKLTASLGGIDEEVNRMRERVVSMLERLAL